MTIRARPPLLIGDFQAGTAVNEHGVTCIFLGYINEEKERVSIDEIEAKALYEWLGRALTVKGDCDAG